ncbi:hypothetical protein ACFSYG_12025 [Leeuwenhoekiella polynyae]|uniref:Uncharacterized protein n=1 Tax=Leeuwenhoekiella polynyae TaxID=1550906 RepID=A0A4Q0PFH0_9FLAO|nr:hypothetical protein [Leeuwenhoekiella polynyae]RXG25677.1 hypothetical protein DSM02_844 [Leeuwenhoekiella polynyae]
MPITEAGNNRDKSYFDLTFQEKAEEVYNSLVEIQNNHKVSIEEAALIFELVIKKDMQLSSYYDGVFNDSNFNQLLKKLNSIDESLEQISSEIQDK